MAYGIHSGGGDIADNAYDCSDCDDDCTDSPQDIRLQLRQLIQHLRYYDLQRISLEKKGGRIADLNRITRLLTQPVFVERRFFGKRQVALTDRDALEHALSGVHPNLYISVRQRPAGMPVYYIYRIARCWDANYHFIVEEVYISLDYPRSNPRFAKLMHGGHEKFFLNMAPFRQGYAGMTGFNDPEDRRRIDDFLCDHVGRHVFQSAWHEDQQLGNALAAQLAMPDFRYAIELLYLCLSADPCELRGAVTEEMKEFFRIVYPQPAIRALLNILPNLDGSRLNDLYHRAIELYQLLSKAFSQFLASKVPWGCQNARISLWKVLYANVSRLDLVGQSLQKNRSMEVAKNRLVQVSRFVVLELATEKNVS